MNVLSTFATQAENQKLPFLLIGGHAVNIHGYSRFTEDIDLLISRGDLAGWEKLLAESGYRMSHDGGTFRQFESNGPQSPGLSRPTLSCHRSDWYVSNT